MDKRRFRWCLFLSVVAVMGNIASMILWLHKGRWLLAVLHLVLIVSVIRSFVSAWRAQEECKQAYERLREMLMKEKKYDYRENEST